MSGYTPGDWTTNSMRPVTVENGTATVHHDAPIECWPVKSIQRDEKGRRVTTYVAQALRCGQMSDAALQANARLIAAAPALLEALEALVVRLDSHFGGPERNHDWKEQEEARAAISLAKGEKP